MLCFCFSRPVHSQKVMASALGPSWRDNFIDFELVPFAAASIGQVHRAVLNPVVVKDFPGVSALSPSTSAAGDMAFLPSASSIGDLPATKEGGIRVAVKVQFPNIRQSVESDLGYVSALLTAGRVLPKGLFLNRTIKVRFFWLLAFLRFALQGP